MSAPTFIQELRRHARVVVTTERITASRARPDDTEYWHEVGAAGEVGWLNGWGNYGGGYNPVSFRKDNSGFVHLRGMVEANPATGNVIFTLPASWSPPVMFTHPCAHAMAGASAGEVETLYVHANGDVEAAWTSGRVINYVSLDSIKWRSS